MDSIQLPTANDTNACVFVVQFALAFFLAKDKLPQETGGNKFLTDNLSETKLNHCERKVLRMADAVELDN